MDAGALVPFGDRALRFALPADADRRALLAALRAVAGVVDVVLAEDVGAIMLAEGIEAAAVSDAVRAALAARSPTGVVAPPARHVVRVVYDGEDLAEVASHTGLAPDDVAELHARGDYEVAMLGFLPGFAYLRGLDPRLVLPRRAHPRPRVPAGSVAIAAEYTGIYPLASPGGWSLLGRAVGPRVFDVHGAAFALGDRVRFERAEPSELDSASSPAPSPPAPAPRGPHLEIVKAQGPAIVVDGGRFGHMHEGVPHGGAMVPASLARANAACGNAPGAAALEIFGVLEVVARGGSITVADDARGPRSLRDGESFSVATEGRARVRYLAVRHGLDVPLVLDSRSTLLVAALGGHLGRPLARGDRLPLCLSPLPPTPTPHPTPTAALSSLPLLPGPDATPEILAALPLTPFTISPQSDRIGTRLASPSGAPPLPAHPMQSARDRRSAPMIRGAVELTPSGLVVLGPDHPTTGGYPVVALLPAAALGALLTLPVGAPVRFSITP